MADPHFDPIIILGNIFVVQYGGTRENHETGLDSTFCCIRIVYPIMIVHNPPSLLLIDSPHLISYINCSRCVRTSSRILGGVGCRVRPVKRPVATMQVRHLRERGALG